MKIAIVCHKYGVSPIICAPYLDGGKRQFPAALGVTLNRAHCGGVKMRKVWERRRLSVEDRLILDSFLDEESGCRLWTGRVDKNGYGKIHVNGKHCRTHRVAWECAYGEIPDGLFVLHKCDRESCINTDHLFIGTHIDNMKDMREKNRQAHGSHIANSKLTENTVEEIRSIAKIRKRAQSSLARNYGVSKSTISRIILGKTWRDVK